MIHDRLPALPSHCPTCGQRVDGYTARCSCGWVGTAGLGIDDANDDWRKHERQIAAFGHHA